MPGACDDTRRGLTEKLTRALPRPVLMREVRDAGVFNVKLPFADVAKVRENDLATGWKIGNGVGTALAIFLIVVATEVIGDG